MEGDVQKIIQERFEQLPEQVRTAITSTRMNEQLREMEKKYGLHVDQWAVLENQIMLTVLGLADVSTMVDDIVAEVGIDKEKARTIVDDVALNIFKPMREELERELDNPDAKEKHVSGIEAARDEILSHEGKPASADASKESVATNGQATSPTVPIAPAPVARGEAPAAYKPGMLSTERKEVHNDPYRESPM